MGKTKNQWMEELSDIEKRWFVFAERLEQRVKEFVEASIPELQEAYKNDTDVAKRGYQRLADSVEGQIDSVRKKADITYDKRVEDYYEWAFEVLNSSDEDSLQGLEDTAHQMEMKCQERYKKLEKVLDEWSKKVTDTSDENLESKYQAILDEYEQIKDKFTCKQCSSPITIPHIFLTTTYVECSSCQTQNTFEPSSRSRELDYLGQELAEQRMAHMYKAYEDEKEKEEALYDQISDLESEIDDVDDEDTKALAPLKEKMAALKAEQKAMKARIPELYKAYLKAKFDEWIKLVPQLAEQNQKVYEGWLRDYERRGE